MQACKHTCIHTYINTHTHTHTHVRLREDLTVRGLLPLPSLPSDAVALPSPTCRYAPNLPTRRIRQHTSAYVSRPDVSIRQHTSAYASMRQHTSAYVSRQHTSAYVSIRQHTSAYVSMRQHTSAYVSLRQLTSGYVSIRATAALPSPTCRERKSRQIVVKLNLLALLVQSYKFATPALTNLQVCAESPDAPAVWVHV
jgi:hypothetical protein